MTYSIVSPEIKAKVKNLTLQYLETPQPELLIVVPNPHPDLKYEEKLKYPEFTSLCPLAPSQPDYATITISYIPKEKIIELKSLKFYLVSYREVQIFHEAVVGQILKDLVSCCQPKRMRVSATFTVRGGITTTIESSFEGNLY